MRPSETASKPEWRGWAAATRDRLPPVADGYLAPLDLLLCALPRGSVVLGYRAFRSEPSLEALPGAYPRLVWAVTRARRDGELSLHPWASAVASGPLGFLEPPSGAPVIAPAAVRVALLPGLAFDASGARLGYGRGYFDRLLLRLDPEALTIGVTRSALVVERLPQDPWDVTVRRLLTDAGLQAARAVMGDTPGHRPPA